MREQTGILQALKLILAALASGGAAFFLLRKAFHSDASVFDPLEEIGDYLAVGGTALVFCAILYRMQQRTWTREHVDELLNIDDKYP
jgi:hypothetical protein